MRSFSVLGSIWFFVAILKLQSVIAEEYRLTNDVFPLIYNITITPYFLPQDGNKRFTLYGETDIVINARKSDVREFAVHADYLDFEEVKVRSVTGKEQEFTTEYEEVTDKLIFRLTEAMPAFVNYTLSFKYTGRIFDGYGGFYRINYTDIDDKERWMVATQLQRIDARKVFPCFDEPSFKARFNISISRPKNFRSFSNAVLLETSIDKKNTDRYVDRFDTTPRMSTYLVAMLVAEYTEHGQDDIFIISRPEYYNKTEFSLNVTSKLIDHYNRLFGIGYAVLGNPVLRKASLSKFTHNGMENWGLMFYKDEVLVYEDNHSDLSNVQYTMTIISHETSHNWFGNSITFEWWGYFWLNEGFARYYQYFATNSIYPEFELDKQFVVDQLHLILNTDALNSTQPLSEPDVASPSEIARKFSSITYVKGASIIRMISHAMGEQYFEKAIRRYISNNRNKSVKPSDLIDVLKMFWPTVPSVDVDEFFHDWTEKVGFPMLTVTLVNDNRTVTVKQNRYLTNQLDGINSSLRYTIPLTFTTNFERNFSKTYPTKYLQNYQDELVFELNESADWVIFNIQQTSYYRVMYDTKIWNRINEALKKENWSGIHVINRAQLIDDLFAFARGSRLEYDWIFKWLEYLETELYYLPWESAFKGFSFVSAFLTVEEHIDFGKYIMDMTTDVFTRLGVAEITDEPILDTYNRKKVVDLNCKYGNAVCKAQVRAYFDAYISSGVEIPVNMRQTIYCSAMRDGSEVDFLNLLRKFKSQKVVKEKLRIRYGLGCGRNKKNMEGFLDFVLKDADVAVGDKEDALAPLYKENPENVWPAYEMITSRLDEVAESLDSWSRTASLISSIATRLTTEEQRDVFDEFIEENRSKFGVSAATLDSALRTLEGNLEWAEYRLSKLHTYLKGRNGAGPTTILSVLVFLLPAILKMLF